jgi:hypothetical protein
MNKAISHGLKFKDTVVIDGDENTCPIHDSLKEMAHGIYEIITLGKHYFRPIGAEPIDAGDAIKTTINETIDATVFDRWRSNPTYRPKNLSDWASRRGIDPGALRQALLAKDATPIVTAATQPSAAEIFS